MTTDHDSALARFARRGIVPGWALLVFVLAATIPPDSLAETGSWDSEAGFLGKLSGIAETGRTGMAVFKAGREDSFWRGAVPTGLREPLRQVTEQFIADLRSSDIDQYGRKRGAGFRAGRIREAGVMMHAGVRRAFKRATGEGADIVLAYKLRLEIDPVWKERLPLTRNYSIDWINLYEFYNGIIEPRHWASYWDMPEIMEKHPDMFIRRTAEAFAELDAMLGWAQAHGQALSAYAKLRWSGDLADDRADSCALEQALAMLKERGENVSGFEIAFQITGGGVKRFFGSSQARELMLRAYRGLPQEELPPEIAGIPTQDLLDLVRRWEAPTIPARLSCVIRTTGRPASWPKPAQPPTEIRFWMAPALEAWAVENQQDIGRVRQALLKTPDRAGHVPGQDH